MERAALTAGKYHSPGWNQDYRRIQILTIEQLLKGVKVDMPPTAQTFKQAPKAARSAASLQSGFRTWNPNNQTGSNPLTHYHAPRLVAPGRGVLLCLARPLPRARLQSGSASAVEYPLHQSLPACVSVIPNLYLQGE
jgi:hypothetical protein